MKKLSREPIERGKIYCSPACGRGCTKVEYYDAMRKARRLKLKMKSPGWEIRVLENLNSGWCYCIFNGPINIHPIKQSGLFECVMSDRIDNHDCGYYRWYLWKRFKDPNKLVREQVRLARRHVDQLNLVVEFIEKQIKVKP